MKSLFKSKLFWIVVVLAVVIIAIVASAGGASQSGDDTHTVTRGEVRSEVLLSGKVKPISEMNLAFLSTGRVSWIGVKVGSRVYAGQALASLEHSGLTAQLDQAKASLAIENSALDSMLSGNRPEDIEIARIRLDNAEQTLANKEVLLRDAASSAYVKSENAIHYYVDQFYTNPKSTNAQISIAIPGEYEARLESERPAVEDVLRSWQVKLSANPDEEALASSSREALSKLREFSSYLALAINAMTPSANTSATVLAGYKTDVSTLRTTLESELSAVTAAIQAWVDARSNAVLLEEQYNLAKAPARAEDLSAQRARVSRAEAEVARLQSEIYRTSIHAPATGLVASQDFEVGEIASPSDSKIRVISDKALSVEVNVVEADVVAVRVGQEVEVTTDAYSREVVFRGLVTELDPAETIVDGVSTYKARISFVNEDEQLKAGMTANVAIVVDRKDGVIWVPARFLTSLGGKEGVYVLDEKGQPQFHSVAAGLRGSDGRVEITSGLVEGEKIVFQKAP
jgi:HlyD family secretion protein